MIEHIHHDVEGMILDKNEKLKKKLLYQIDFDVEYTTLNSMCKDILEILKDKNNHYIVIVKPVWKGLHFEIEKVPFDFQWIKKIVFEEYYVVINDYTIFYNAIFDFYGG